MNVRVRGELLMGGCVCVLRVCVTSAKVSVCVCVCVCVCVLLCDERSVPLVCDSVSNKIKKVLVALCQKKQLNLLM